MLLRDVCRMRFLITSVLYSDNLQLFCDTSLSKRSCSSTYKNARRVSCFRRKSGCKIATVFLIIYLVIHVCATRDHENEKEHGEFCRYWCRTIDHRYYCCPSGKPESWPEYVWHSYLYPWLWMSAVEFPLHSFWPETFVHEKETKKHCPPMRTQCPRTYDWHSPLPTLCHNDEDCHEWEKCCYDVCLEHKTCKPGE